MHRLSKHQELLLYAYPVFQTDHLTPGMIALNFDIPHERVKRCFEALEHFGFVTVVDTEGPVYRISREAKQQLFTRGGSPSGGLTRSVLKQAF